MSWASPRVYVPGQVMTVAIMNEISDNLKHLKGMAGTVAIDAGVTASGVVEATDGLVGRLSGFVAGTPVSGDSDITVSGLVTAGAGLVTISHISALGNLTVSGIVNTRFGLTTPMHISAAGSISVGGTVGGIDLSDHNTPQSGSHGLLCILSGAMAVVNCGSYTGNGSGHQFISHGLGRYPKIALIQAVASGYQVGRYIGPYATWAWMTADSFDLAPTASMGPGNFSVGTITSGMSQINYMNGSGIAYYWSAFG